MKGLKKIGLIALSLAFVGAVASCGSSKGSSTTATSIDTNNVTIDETDSAQLSSFTLDTANATKTFYVGQEFSSEGLVITRNYKVSYADGTLKGYAHVVSDDYTVDYSEFDNQTVGEYQISVKVRTKTTILTQKYTVNVKSSLFESTAGLTYVAGINATYADGTNAFESTLYESIDLDEIKNNLNLTLHKRTVDSTGNKFEETTETVALTDAKLTIDSSSVNSQKVGTYKIMVSYAGDDLTIDGKTYTNQVEAFLIIDVVNPITNIQIMTDNVLFQATIDGIDAEEAGWKVRVNTKVGVNKEGGPKYYVEDFSYDKYSITGIDIFKWDVDQEAVVTMLSNPEISTSQIIKITESETQNIVPYYDITPTKINATDGKIDSYLVAGTDFIYGPTLGKNDTKGLLPILEAYVDENGSTGSAGATVVGERTDTYGSISFPCRYSVSGTSQAFKFVMPTAGQLVVFFATTKEEERSISLFGADATGAVGAEIATAATSEVKQEIVRCTFDITEAGTYYVASTDGVYVHGFIIATAK